MTRDEAIAAAAAIDKRYTKYLGSNVTPSKVVSTPLGLPCIYRGKEKVGVVKCPTCRKGGTSSNLFSCAVYGTCTLSNRVEGHGCCDSKCTRRMAPPE